VRRGRNLVTDHTHGEQLKIIATERGTSIMTFSSSVITVCFFLRVLHDHTLYIYTNITNANKGQQNYSQRHGASRPGQWSVQGIPAFATRRFRGARRIAPPSPCQFFFKKPGDILHPKDSLGIWGEVRICGRVLLNKRKGGGVPKAAIAFSPPAGDRRAD
jgi:hypothetical protein